MTLEEIRRQIDTVDSQIKPLFLQRMECAGQVAEEKARTGGEVFVLERELEIVQKRTEDVDEDIREEYAAFLRHLMSVCRRYEYGYLKCMQNEVVDGALAGAGLCRETEHEKVRITCSCKASCSNLHLYLNMAALNQIPIEKMSVTTEADEQVIDMTLMGNVNDGNMRQFLCQIGKESDHFTILALE